MSWAWQDFETLWLLSAELVASKTGAVRAGLGDTQRYRARRHRKPCTRKIAVQAVRQLPEDQGDSRFGRDGERGVAQKDGIETVQVFLRT